MEQSRVNVLIAGTPRGGSTAVARALHAAGLGVGESRSGDSAAPREAADVVERRDIAAFDDRFLESLGWSWDAPGPEPLASPPDRPGLVAEGRAHVLSVFAGEPAWLFSDPRISLLLPWWRRILVDRFVLVVPMRPIAEIAWELHVDSELPLALGAALTGAYLRHLGSGAAGLPVVTVSYAALTDRPEVVMPPFLEALARAGVRADLDADAAVATVDPSERRATQPPDVSLGSLVSTATAELLAAWSDEDVRLAERLDVIARPPAPWEAAMLDLQRRLRRMQREVGQAQRAVRALQERTPPTPSPGG